MLAKSLALLALPMLVGLSACSRSVDAQDGEARSVESQTWALDASGEEGGFSIKVQTIDEQGTQRVRIRFAPGVAVLWRSGTVFMSIRPSGGLEDNQQEGLFADGERIEVVGRELLVGGRSLGALPDVAEVEIRSDGVFVDDERRGALR